MNQHEDKSTINTNSKLISTIQAEGYNCEPIKECQKPTYSAQHQQSSLQKNISTMANNASRKESVSFLHCNAMPLYNVSSGMTNQRRNFEKENALPNYQMPYSCPCSAIPPPVPPLKEDLWDLQFCRWWGWNWVRKREEMLNQKKAEIKIQSNESKSSVTEKTKVRKKKKRSKQDDFCTWWNKLFKKPNKKSQLKTDKKKQLQKLYDTPCSSVMFNSNCPCPINEWECRSIKLKGDYECYGGSTGQASLSTVLVQNNKTRRQACKQQKRKLQSWIIEKTDTSSSEECCHYMKLRPCRGESSADESVEYLSLRMAHLKSDSEDNIEFCPCVKTKECKRNLKSICCPYKCHKKDICCGCPHKVRFICDKPYGVSKQRYVIKQTDNSPLPCKSLPICQIPPPKKVPQLCRSSPARNTQPLAKPFPQIVRHCKRKYIPETCCLKNKEYILHCPCQFPPRKIMKTSKKHKKIYRCCCCCCCCCNHKIELQHESAESPNIIKSKYTQNIQEREDQNINNANTNVNHNFMSNSPPFAYTTGLQRDNLQLPTVSQALNKGLYTSPLTEKTYTLHPTFFSINDKLSKNTWPKPFDINKEIFNFNFLQSSLVDEEHKSLLNAVCSAILSSRTISKVTNKFHSSQSKPLAWDNFKFSPVTKRRNSRMFQAHREHFLTQQNSNEVLTHNYESDQTDYSYQTKDEVDNRNLPIPHILPFVVSKDLKSNKLDDPLTISSSVNNIIKNNSDMVNASNFIKSNNKLAFPKKKNVEMVNSENAKSYKTKIPIRIKNGLLKQKQSSNTINGEMLLNTSSNSLQDQAAENYTNLRTNISENDTIKDTFQSTLQKQNHKEAVNNFMKLPFKSPHNWITSRFSDMSSTGIIPVVTGSPSSLENKYKINIEPLKKSRIYDVSLANDNALPSSSVLNHLPNRPALLQELSRADIIQATQTQRPNASTSVEAGSSTAEEELPCIKSQEKKLRCFESNTMENAQGICPKFQKPIFPTYIGTNTTVSCIKHMLEFIGKQENKNYDLNTLFSTETESENKISCMKSNVETPKKVSINDTATLTESISKEGKSVPTATRFYVKHEQQDFKVIRNLDNLINNFEGVINTISEETSSDLVNTTDLDSNISTLTEASSLQSFVRDPNTRSIGISPGLLVSQYSQIDPKTHMVDSTTPPFKIKYTTIRRGDRIETDYSQRKIVKKEYPYPMSGEPVMSKSIGPKPVSNKNSISRSERQMAVSKLLKERERRWKY